ncbi:MAG TPA: carbohydrate binding domain-containing protein, partial [Terracidiphilus sp.]|nr:carbohydrate binding domain-containing protein [Terracidiphilus sp.]
MRKKTFAGPIALAAFFAATLACAQQPAVLTIQADQPVSPVSPTLYGLMTEEINYSYEGGLYAEMVRNRTFHSDWSGTPYWYLLQDGNAEAQMSIDSQTGPSEALKTSMRLDVQQADPHHPAGVINEGWWGFALRPNTTYKGSFYAKADSSDLGPVTVSLVGNNSAQVEAAATVPALSTQWKQYQFIL